MDDWKLLRWSWDLTAVSVIVISCEVLFDIDW